MKAERNQVGSRSWPLADARRWCSAEPATWISMLDIHYGANDHVHERNHSDDAGKPGAMKVASRGLGGDGWNRSKQLTPRQPSTLLFQDVKARGGVSQPVSNLCRGRS